jgi:hypothetical protein
MSDNETKVRSVRGFTVPSWNVKALGGAEVVLASDFDALATEKAGLQEDYDKQRAETMAQMKLKEKFADECLQMQADRDRLRAALEWQPVATPPPLRGNYLAVVVGRPWRDITHDPAVMLLYFDGNEWEDEECVTMTITHWMCLPATPALSPDNTKGEQT